MRPVALALTLPMLACGSVTTTPDAGEELGVVDASAVVDAEILDAAPDAPAPDACVPSLALRSNFVANDSAGSGASTLDPIRGQTNSFAVNFSEWTVAKVAVADDFGGQVVFKSAVQSSDWSITFSNTNAELLNSELGQWLSQGAAEVQSVFEIGGNGRYYLYLLPENATLHPYMAVTCRGADAPLGDDGYPLLQDTSLFGCDITFYDFRAGVSKNLLGNATASFEIETNECL